MKQRNLTAAVLIAACLILTGINSYSQKQRAIANEQLPKIYIPITREMEELVAKTVQPVVDKLDKLFKEDLTGTYQAYVADVQKLGKLQRADDKRQLIKQIQSKYYSFIKQTWDRAKIDENDYKLKIRKIFPAQLAETIQFTEFLNFSVKGESQKPAPPPAPPPAPAKICVDALRTFFTDQATTKSGIGDAVVTVTKNNIYTLCGSSTAGHMQAQARVLSDIKVPGTFPDDSKSVRIVKNYLWKADATAVTILGASFATISTSMEPLATDVFIRVWAPVIWVSSVSKNEVRSATAIVNKRFLMNLRFGVDCYSDTYAGAIAGSVATSTCDNLTWSECEE